jgi:hypothetical protein
MNAPTVAYNGQPLPITIRIVDVSPLHETVATPKGPSGAARALAATKANVVRLIPGVTRFPVGAESISPSAAR